MEYLHFIITPLITLCMYYLFERYAGSLGLVDHPNDRSSHSKPILRGFGIGMYVSILISLSAFYPSLISDYRFFFVATTMIVILGLFDDIKNSSFILKMLVIAVSFWIASLNGFLITNLGYYFGYEIILNESFLAIFFTLFSIMAFTNAFNLIDGLDGLSGLLALIILCSFFYIGYINHDQFLIIIPVFFIISILVFLIFNWHPASIFMGDSGSLMIGFVISMLGIKSLDYIEPVAIFYITALPILDSLIVFTRRIFHGNSPFSPDKSHLHHILLFCLDGNVPKTVIMIALVQTIFSIVGVFWIIKVDDSFIPLFGFTILLVLLYKLLTTRYLIQKIKQIK